MREVERMDHGSIARRGLPQVQKLLECPAAETLCASYGRAAVTAGLRDVLAVLRRQIAEGSLAAMPDVPGLLAQADRHLAARRRPGLRRVINATGILLHTNLGRAPLAAEALAAVQDVAGGYCNLEFDFHSGKRGARTQAVEPLLQGLTGAEAAIAVNNGAAAILLALSALADGGEVIVSRGELVEIGGGFRIPDVIRQGGAKLVEVGSTNKTRLADYRAAITPETRVLLKVHQSNFRTLGFTAETGIAELAGLAVETKLLVVADLGSGLLHETRGSPEPTLAQALAAGADLVTCSGDKLLGGPQAGLILGKLPLLERIRRHPLLRAVRLDKMSLAALEATLRLHRDTPERVPVHAMLRQTGAALQSRAASLLALLGTGALEQTAAFAGGGALPEEQLVSWAVAIVPPHGADALAAKLRAQTPAVIGRISGAKLLLDIFAVTPADIPQLAQTVRDALG